MLLLLPLPARSALTGASYAPERRIAIPSSRQLLTHKRAASNVPCATKPTSASKLARELRP